VEERELKKSWSRTDTQVILYSVQCCALHWTDNYVCDYSGFLPVAVNFLRRVPVIGYLLYLPGISHVCMNCSHSQLHYAFFRLTIFTFCHFGVLVLEAGCQDGSVKYT